MVRPSALSFAIVVSAVATLAAASAAPQAPARVHVLDDAAAPPGPGRAEGVLTDGRWEFVRGRRDGRVHGTSTRSFHAGDAIQVRFTGDGVLVRGITGPAGGLALVAVDREHAQRIDFYSPVKHVGVVVWSRIGLVPGPHACSIVVLGRRAPGSRGSYVNIDAFDVIDTAGGAR